jgi:hypothetical protein
MRDNPVMLISTGQWWDQFFRERINMPYIPGECRSKGSQCRHCSRSIQCLTLTCCCLSTLGSYMIHIYKYRISAVGTSSSGPTKMPMRAPSESTYCSIKVRDASAILTQHSTSMSVYAFVGNTLMHQHIMHQPTNSNTPTHQYANTNPTGHISFGGNYGPR